MLVKPHTSKCTRPLRLVVRSLVGTDRAGQIAWMMLLLFSLAGALALLAVEKRRLDRSRARIPLRIAVTGTRGKSTVTRMLASVLRESGVSVLAKTTGSEALMILPDGSKAEIRRRGFPSIIEQKRLMHLGASLGVDVVVAEIMSLHAENHFVESQQILDPHVVLVTNFRVDHTAAAGPTREDVASVIGLDVPRGAKVIIPKRECTTGFRVMVEEQAASLIEVPAQTGAEGLNARAGQPSAVDNVNLVRTAAAVLNIDDEATDSGLAKAGGDLGSLAVWRYQATDAANDCYVVSAFAANDPESTQLIFEQAAAMAPAGRGEMVGLMTLRADRGDRTRQWAEYLAAGGLDRLAHLYLCGVHAHALKRRLTRAGADVPIDVLDLSRPDRITQRIAAGMRDSGGVIFGFGNMKGLGESLVKHWRQVGQALTV